MDVFIKLIENQKDSGLNNNNFKIDSSFKVDNKDVYALRSVAIFKGVNIKKKRIYRNLLIILKVFLIQKKIKIHFDLKSVFLFINFFQ